MPMKKNDFKAILWDNDGILVETEKWYFEATKQIMAKEGFNLSINTYRDTFLKKNTGAWHLLENTNEKQAIRLRKKRNELYSSYLKTKDITMKGISKILETLCEQYAMGIVTSSRKEHFDIIHEKTDLLKYFNFIITSENFKKSKPNPEPYLLGIKETGLKASECFAIEDSERGVIAAKEANLFCFAVPNEMTKNSDFSRADIILNDLSEIFTFLK